MILAAGLSPEAVRFLGQLFLAVCGGGVVVAIINQFLSPRTKAETRSIALKSAQEAVDQALTTLRADLASARARADTADAKADEAEARIDASAVRERLLVAYMWDLMAWSKRWYDGAHPPGMPAPPEPPAQLTAILPNYWRKDHGG